MRKIGDIVIYKKAVCEITDLKKNFYKGMDYYSLSPINDKSLKVDVPVMMADKLLRDLITKDDFEAIIAEIPDITIIDCNDKEIENVYKELMQRGTHKDLIKIIKTAYLRNKERKDNNKKTTDKDESYFAMAEQYLYSELAVVYNISYEKAKEYVVGKVSELESK